SSTAAKEFGKESTAGSVAYWIDARPETRKEFKLQLVPNDADKQIAAEVMVWLGTLAGREELNDYMYNLSLLATSATISKKSFGLICSAIATYLREQEREINRKKRLAEDINSQYVGEVGKRSAFEVTLVYTNSFATNYGVTHM